MKYINKKLPLVPVGKEIKHQSFVTNGVHCFDNGQLHCNAEDLQKLICEGWIEEVKPREFYVGENNEGGMSVPNEDEGFVRVSGYWDKITKLIEVIE